MNQSFPTSPGSVRAALVEQLCNEGLTTIVAAAAAEGVKIGPKQALRWGLHGTGGAKLETVKVGGKRMTSRQAFRRFVAAQQCAVAASVPVLDEAGADRVLAAHGLPREERQ